MYISVKFKLWNKQASHNAGTEMVWHIGPVKEYEAQCAIIPFVGVITRK
jgi:hypothetical protein